MEQKIIATVGGHQITEAEVEAFIHSLPREQQAYAAHPDFRKQCEEQLIAVYAFAKYGEEEKIDETEEFKNVMENARKDILAQQMMKSKNIMKQINRNIRRVHLYMQNIS